MENAAVGAGIVFVHGAGFAGVGIVNNHDAAGQLQRLLDGLGKSGAVFYLDSVYHDFNGVVIFFRRATSFLPPVHIRRPVDAGTDVALTEGSPKALICWPFCRRLPAPNTDALVFHLRQLRPLPSGLRTDAQWLAALKEMGQTRPAERISNNRESPSPCPPQSVGFRACGFSGRLRWQERP